MKRHCPNCEKRAIDEEDVESVNYHAVCPEHPQGGHSGCQCPQAQNPGR